MSQDRMPDDVEGLETMVGEIVAEALGESRRYLDRALVELEARVRDRYDDSIAACERRLDTAHDAISAIRQWQPAAGGRLERVELGIANILNILEEMVAEIMPPAPAEELRRVWDALRTIARTQPTRVGSLAELLAECDTPEEFYRRATLADRKALDAMLAEIIDHPTTPEEGN